jgi:hypothetical protein
MMMLLLMVVVEVDENDENDVVGMEMMIGGFEIAYLEF